jgi:hypothetical protein
MVHDSLFKSRGADESLLGIMNEESMALPETKAICVQSRNRPADVFRKIRLIRSNRRAAPFAFGCFAKRNPEIDFCKNIFETYFGASNGIHLHG